ncbi:MAG: hypothetical protein ACR2ND_06780 [Solirubrobacteraceae bacterium]
MFADAAARLPAAKVMVVGRAGEILRGPQIVRARAAAVRVPGRRCAVAAGTPLAALEASRVAVRLRDYGTCSSRPRDGTGLFVVAVAGQANRGRDGWVYKLNGRVASAGAADPAGAFGRGATVIWFYCHADAAQHCQRTLSVFVSARRVSSGARLQVHTESYDDQGRSYAAGGASVTLGGVSTRTGRDGNASVTAPLAPGRYRLAAAGAGLVPAVPIPVRVQ